MTIASIAELPFAKRLLGDTGTPLRRSRRQLGYMDVFYFSRQFSATCRCFRRPHTAKSRQVLAGLNRWYRGRNLLIPDCTRKGSNPQPSVPKVFGCIWEQPTFIDRSKLDLEAR